MRSNLRHVAALFALFAFSLFWAEGVWASMCPPAMEMDMSAEVHADAETCPTGMQMPASEPDERGSEGPHCPMAAIGVSCAAGLSLPVESATPVLAPLAGAPLVGSPDHAKDLLLAVALFHPPRA